jgi:hypothetical protein
MEYGGDILPLLESGYAFGLRDKHICDLTGISAGTLSRAKNGSEPLRGQAWLDVKNLILDCEELNRRNPLPPNWTDLRAVRQQLEALQDEKNNPPEDPTHEDFQLMSSEVGKDPAAYAAKLGISTAELLSRISEALRRFDFTIRKMQESTQGIRDLAVANRVEFEERKANQFGRSK